MRVFVLMCVVGACLAWPNPQDTYDPLYRDAPQYYQDDPRYSLPAPKADQYRPEPPKYQKYPKEEDDEEEYEHGNTIPGEPGKDYPVFGVVPSTAFSCSDKLPGFYADGEANCQVWHYCKTDGLKESFLANGTIYNQENRVCEWWFNVSCDLDALPGQARINEDLYIVPSPKPEDEYSQGPSYSIEATANNPSGLTLTTS